MPLCVVEISLEAGKPRPEVLVDVLTHVAVLAATERVLGKLPRTNLADHVTTHRLHKKCIRGHQKEATS